MSTIRCPKCEAEVSLPLGAASTDSQVECPLCHEQYSLGEATENMPPQLILMEVLSDDMDLVAETAAADLGFSTGEPSSGSFDPQSAGATATSSTADEKKKKTSSRQRKPKKPKSVGKELAKIAFGGVAGLAIAFSILFYGFKKDPFDVAKHLPENLVPEEIIAKKKSPLPENQDSEDDGDYPNDEIEDENNGDSGDGNDENTDNGIPDDENTGDQQTVGGDNGNSTNPDSLVEDDPPETVEKSSLSLIVDNPKTVDDLKTARAVAQEGTKLLIDQEKPTTREISAGFRKLCILSEAAAHTQDDDDEVLTESLDKVSQLVLILVEHATNANVIGKMGNALAQMPDKRKSDGILLVGTVHGIDVADGTTTFEIALPAATSKIKEKKLGVTYNRAIELNEGDEIIVIGKFVNEPAKEIDGYSGVNFPIVWAATVALRNQPE